MLTLPDDGAVQLPVEALDGANVWLLEALNASLAPAGSPVTLWGVHAPDALWQDGQVTQDALNSYLLDTLGFDCVLDPSLETASSAARFALLHPHEAFGYAVVGRVLTPVTIDAAARLWTWVRAMAVWSHSARAHALTNNADSQVLPFSPGVWGVIVAMFFASAALMQWYEGDGERGEYAKFNARAAGADGTRASAAASSKRSSYHVSKFGHGLYLSFSSFATNNSQTFTAKTLPGRIYRISYAFVILLTGSCYIANLAAVLSYAPPPAAAITSISSFEELDTPACVLNNSLHIAFLQTHFPSIKLHILYHVGDGSGGDFNPEQTERDLLAELAAPDSPCLGGVAPDDALIFWMGPVGDPQGEFCNLQLVSQPLSQGLIGLVMHRNTTGAQLAALNGAVIAELASGRYAAAMTERENFPTVRHCTAAVAAEDVPQSLGLADFSGIFLVLAFGALTSVVAQLALTAAPRALAPGSLLLSLTQRALARPSTAGASLVPVGRATDAPSPSGAVAEAMAAHALSLAVLRNAAGVLADSGAALEAALAQAAQAAADGAVLSQAEGAAVVAANAA